MDEVQLLSYVIVPAGKDSTDVVAEKGIREAIDQAGIQKKDIEYIAATGGERNHIP